MLRLWQTEFCINSFLHYLFFTPLRRIMYPKRLKNMINKAEAWASGWRSPGFSTERCYTGHCCRATSSAGCSPEHELGETCLHGYQLLLLPPLHLWMTTHHCSTLARVDSRRGPLRRFTSGECGCDALRRTCARHARHRGQQNRLCFRIPEVWTKAL